MPTKAQAAEAMVRIQILLECRSKVHPMIDSCLARVPSSDYASEFGEFKIYGAGHDEVCDDGTWAIYWSKVGPPMDWPLEMAYEPTGRKVEAFLRWCRRDHD